MPLAMALLLTLLLVPAAQAASDQVVLSGSVTVPRGETAGTVVIVHGPARIAGRVDGDVVAIDGRVAVTGVVTGDVVAVSAPARLGPSARVGGDLLYGDEAPAIASGARVDGKVSDQGWAGFARNGLPVVSAIAIWIAVSLSTLALGLLLIGFAPRAADAALAAAREAPWQAVAWGAGLFIGLPVAAVLAILTLVGVPLGLAVLLALLPLGAVGYATAGFLLGRVVAPSAPRVTAFLAGLGMLRVAAIIPWVGGAAWVLGAAFGLGALFAAAWRHRGRGARPDPAFAAPVSPTPAR